MTTATRHADVDLVIFDSDGVLVDSETIALRVLAHAATAAGADIATEESLRLFRGLKISDCVLEIERLAGRPVAETFVEDVRNATAVAFQASLKAIPGVRSALAAISLPVCVASNGPSAKLDQTLRLTRLHRRFKGRVFSAYEVQSWKPDPGLFLHAAATLGASPSRCVVIEDSTPGVLAAQAAGMRVLGFAGAGADVRAELLAAGAEVFDDMKDLPGLLAPP